jgi:hypothetical protein
MNSKILFIKIVELYHEARIPLFKDRKISRGRSRSISSAAEDLFAKFLISNTKVDKIYIDQPIKTEGFKKQICPDLAIIKNNKITHLIDLKMDLGWKRDGLLDFCNKWQSIINDFKGTGLKLRDGESKKDFFYKYRKTLTYNIVIVSAKNISNKKLMSQITESKKNNKDVNVYVLSKGAHPNEYGYTVKEVMNEIIINDKGIKKLLKSIG